MELQHPAMLWLALLVPLALYWRRRRGAAAAVMPAVALLAAGRSVVSLRQRLLPLPRVLEVVGLVLVVVALARPVRREALPLRAEGIDILLCIDRSSSMAAQDMDAVRTRLALAKAAAAEFAAGRPHDRIGLLGFAAYADLLCPPTLDHRGLALLLDELEMVEADGAEDLTGIGTAVARAAQLLGRSAARSRVVILLTDGEENVAGPEAPDEIGPLQAAQVCREIGIRVYTIVVGIGAPGPRGTWLPLDTRLVRQLAETTGGGFYQARDAGAVRSVYATIDQLEKVPFEHPRFRVVEAFFAFAALGLALLLGGVLLDVTVLRVLP